MSDQLVTKCCNRDPVKTRNLAATETLKSLPISDGQVWTDGSAMQSVTSGGSGVLISGTQMVETELLAQSGLISSSYKADCVILKTTLEWLRNSPEFVGGKTLHVYTYSKCLVNKLPAGPQVAGEISELETWDLLKDCSDLMEELHIQWVPRRAKPEGNQSADRVAQLATKLDQTLQPLDFSSTQTTIKKCVARTWRR